MVGSTGLLLQEGEHWRFAAELVRDELAAELMEAEGFLQLTTSSTRKWNSRSAFGQPG